MNNKVAKKYGLFMCLCMIIGTVIGVGIFFKNASVYGFVNGNGTLGIIAWIIGGIAAISFGMSFMEIASAKQDSNSGIALYARVFVNNKFGRVVRHAMSNIYLPLTSFVIAYYTSKASIWVIGGGIDAEKKLIDRIGKANFELLITVFSILYTIFMVSISIYQEKFVKWVQMSTVILKLVPLVLIGLVGLFITNSGAGAFLPEGLGDKTKHDIVKGKSSFEMILLALPGVLFAFDGFLTVTYIQKDVINAKRNVPLSLVLGLTFITIIYVIVSIGTLNLDKSGNVAVAVTKIFTNATVNDIFTRGIFIFIFISAFGGMNGYCFALTKLNKSCVEDQFLIANTWWQKLVTKWGIRMVTLLVTLSSVIVWTLIMSVPTIIMSVPEIANKPVDFIDFTSNAGTIMAFLLYGIIILFGIVNRFRFKVKTIKAWYFVPAAIIAILCISLILGYNVYSYIAHVVTDKNKTSAIIQLVILILVLSLPWFGMLIKEKPKVKSEVINEVNDEVILKNVENEESLIEILT